MSSDESRALEDLLFDKPTSAEGRSYRSRVWERVSLLVELKRMAPLSAWEKTQLRELLAE